MNTGSMLLLLDLIRNEKKNRQISKQMSATRGFNVPVLFISADLVDQCHPMDPS